MLLLPSPLLILLILLLLILLLLILLLSLLLFSTADTLFFNCQLIKLLIQCNLSRSVVCGNCRFQVSGQRIRLRGDTVSVLRNISLIQILYAGPKLVVFCLDVPRVINGSGLLPLHLPSFFSKLVNTTLDLLTILQMLFVWILSAKAGIVWTKFQRLYFYVNGLSRIWDVHKQLFLISIWHGIFPMLIVQDVFGILNNRNDLIVI